jgi:hypothetical protein
MEHEKFMFLLRQQCPKAELEIIALCHPREYIERIRTAVLQIGLVQLDDDTVLSAVVSRHLYVLRVAQSLL